MITMTRRFALVSTLLTVFLIPAARGSSIQVDEAPARQEGLPAATDELPPGVSDLDLARVRELYHLTDTLGDRLWPDFDTRKIPIALNVDDQRELLIAHPSPPDHFRPLVGVEVGDNAVMLRDGVTRYGPRGGGWAIDLAGEQTVYVNTMPAEGGSTEGYLSLMLHEAFHCYQGRYRERGEGTWGETPTDDPRYSALIGLESRILVALLAEPDDAAANELAEMFVAVRHERRRELDAGVAWVEGESEFGEGTATYSQARLLQLLAESGGIEPVAAKPDPRYGAFTDAKKRYTQFLERVAVPPGILISFFHAMYNHGMAQCLVLDRLRPGWKEEMREKGMTQFALLEKSFPLTEEEELERLRAAEERFDFIPLFEEQERLVNERLELIRGYLDPPGRRYRIHHDRSPGHFMWKPRGPVYDAPPSLLKGPVPGGVTIWAGGMDRFEKEGLELTAEGVPILFRRDFLEWIDTDPAVDGSDFRVRSERIENGVHTRLHVETDGFVLDLDRARIAVRGDVVDLLPEADD